MSKESIENRRAFFKKAGKIVGMAALAVPFLMSSTKAEATVTDQEPVSSCDSCYSYSSTCKGRCRNGCSGSCNSYAKWEER